MGSPGAGGNTLDIMAEDVPSFLSNVNTKQIVADLMRVLNVTSIEAILRKTSIGAGLNDHCRNMSIAAAVRAYDERERIPAELILLHTQKCGNV